MSKIKEKKRKEKKSRLTRLKTQPGAYLQTAKGM